MTQEPKHLSQLSAANRALAQQQIQHALLAIVSASGKEVTIPLSDLNIASENFRLVVEQTTDGFLLLRAEMVDGALEIHEAAPHEIDAIANGKLQ